MMFSPPQEPQSGQIQHFFFGSRRVDVCLPSVFSQHDPSLWSTLVDGYAAYVADYWKRFSKRFSMTGLGFTIIRAGEDPNATPWRYDPKDKQ